MAADTFLRIDGLAGEARDAVHAKEFDVLHWSWGLSQSGSAAVGGGAGAGKVDVGDLEFVKHTDTATPDLLLACCNGRHFATATLTVRKAGTKPLEYLVLTLEDVIVTAVLPNCRGQRTALETVRLNFARFRLVYVPQEASGTGGSPCVAAWDVAGNAAI